MRLPSLIQLNCNIASSTTYFYNSNMENREIKHGLRENAFQFWILVLVNAFVGGMVGLERSIFPDLASSEFQIDSTTAILSFIIAFGVSKAVSNYFTGRLANRIGRRTLLIIGWIIAIPIPIILIYSQNWNLIIFANVLLGINQGICWSSTVVMKIDLVGEKDRGFAMGLNEFAGYLAVGIMAYVSAVIAQNYGLRPYPFYLGLVIVFAGLILSIFVVKDTGKHVHRENTQSSQKDVGNVFMHTTFKDRNLSATTQAGLVNNLNDGMIWGLLPILLVSLKYDAKSIGIIAAIYPAVWGIGQLFTGKMSDIYSKKGMLFWGMLLQGFAIVLIPFFTSFFQLAIIASFLGLGTALVYPTFLSAISYATNPMQRAESIGIFRLWRDLGYAIGAIVSGIIADLFGVPYAILTIGCITILSSIIIKLRMPND